MTIFSMGDDSLRMYHGSSLHDSILGDNSLRVYHRSSLHDLQTSESSQYLLEVVQPIREALVFCTAIVNCSSKFGEGP